MAEHNPPALPKVICAVFLQALYNVCYDLRWDRLSALILTSKFNLFPEHRRWQIDRWVGQFRRQNLFPTASESDLQARATEFVMTCLI